jgi:Fur family ferric uptake transcriptional regulator
LDPAVHKVTVYRTLETLKKHGLVDELDLMHVSSGGHFYEWRGETDHAHVTCLRCGRVQEVETPTLERLKARIARDLDMTISVARFELGGVCPSCRPR